jgi:hypothetical protein
LLAIPVAAVNQLHRGAWIASKPAPTMKGGINSIRIAS